MEIWEEHETLHHYTNQAGLEGILRSQSLHATHYKYLNDASEMIHMAPRLVEAVKPAVKQVVRQIAEKRDEIRAKIEEDGGIDSAAGKQATALIDALCEVTFGDFSDRSFFEPYISSLCGHTDEYERNHGLLSLWRSYGREDAYAIVFNTKELVDILRQESAKYHYAGAQIGSVVYDGDEKGFGHEFGNLVEELKAAHTSMLTDKKPVLGDIYSLFISSVSRFKHRGFREEKEVRIVLSPFSDSQVREAAKDSPELYEKEKHKQVRSISFKQGLVPYIDVFGSMELTLPITKIIVGPSVDKDDRRATLERYLALRGLQVEVTVSDTPYV